MTEQELLKKFPILNSKEFLNTKLSILDLGDDGLMGDRGFMIDLFDSNADDDGDNYFYNMLNCVEFINNPSAVAYTTPDKIISLSYPSTEMVPMDGQKFPRWYFVYCHECMHQLWDTFGVADKIKKEQGSYNHQILNIASDCVINDYLDKINKSHKLRPVGGIFPDVLKDQFGVEYDRKKDNQYSLYMKIMALPEMQKAKLEAEFGDKKIKPGKVEKQNGPSGPTPPQPPQGKHSPDFIKGWTQAIKDVLDGKVDPKNFKPLTLEALSKDFIEGYNAAIAQIKKGMEEGLTVTKGGSSGGQNDSDLPDIPWDIDPDKDKNKGGSGGGESGDNNDTDDDSDESENGENSDNGKGKKSGKDGDDGDDSDNGGDDAEEGEGKGKGKDGKDSKEGDSDEKDGEKCKGKGKGKDGDEEVGDADDLKGDGKDDVYGKEDGSQGQGHGKSEIDRTQLRKQIKRHAESIIKQTAAQISGSLGEFLNKCRDAKTLKKPQSDLKLKSDNGSTYWNKNLLDICKVFIRQKLKSKKEYQDTYSRMRRGARSFTAEDMRNRRILQQGREEKKNKIGFDIALYVDKSGSMGDDTLNRVFKAAYSIMDTLKADFGRDKIVNKDKINLKVYIFDTAMKQIPYGSKCSCGGGTYNFDQLLNDIYKRNAQAFLNIVLTDGQFSVNNAATAKLLKQMEGLFVIVTNNGKGSFDDTVQEVKRVCGNSSLKVIYTDGSFTVK